MGARKRWGEEGGEMSAEKGRRGGGRGDLEERKGGGVERKEVYICM